MGRVASNQQLPLQGKALVLSLEPVFKDANPTEFCSKSNTLYTFFMKLCNIVVSATVSKPVSTRNIIHRTYLSPKSQTLSPRPRSIPDRAPTQSEDPISVLPKLKLRWQMSIPLHIPIMKERAYLSREISQSFPPNEKATVGKESQGNWYSPMVSSNTFDPGIRS